MRIVHLLLPEATRYDHDCAAIDVANSLGLDHELLDGKTRGAGMAESFRDLARSLNAGRASVLHVHGTTNPPKKLLAGLRIPWVTDRPIPLPRSLFGAIPKPEVVLLERGVPEAVTDDWFIDENMRRSDSAKTRVGSYVRDAVTKNNSEQALARILRFRDDIEWIAYEKPPAPDELAHLDLWVDPAGSDDDLDGMVCQALACLTPVVAARTKQNVRRLDEGRAGILTPVGDHNELTHAVLNMLFKEEIAGPRREHAARIREELRQERRHKAVREVYEEVTR